MRSYQLHFPKEATEESRATPRGTATPAHTVTNIPHHFMLLSSGQKLQMMTLQPAPSLTVFLWFCLLKEHLVFKIYSLQAKLFFQAPSCLMSYFLLWEAFLCVVCSVKPK